MQICAVIVTYQRPKKLEDAVRSILSARVVPSEILIINNGDDAETDLVLAKLQKIYDSVVAIKTRKNLGGAGGFFVGLKAGYDRGATHFWMLDDDAYCESDSLSKLLEALEALSETEEVGFLCSRVNWSDGQMCQMNQPVTTWDWPRWYSEDLPVVKVAACSFVSCFFERKILEQVGLPIKEFFIWFDDQEFTYRISDKYSCYCVLNSKVIHDMPENKAAYYAEVNNDNVWKFKYGAANESWFRLRRKSIFHWLLFWAQKNWDMHQGRVSFRNRARINWAMLKGMFRRHRVRDVQTFKLENLLGTESTPSARTLAEPPDATA